MGSALRLGVVGIVALVAALVVFSWGSSGSDAARPAPLGRSVNATLTPTLTPALAPTPTPTPEPTATRTPQPTHARTAEPTPEPTRKPAPAAAGRADIRFTDVHFTGMHPEDYEQALGGTSGCSTTTARGGSAPTLTGFEIESGATSRPRWQLTLDDLTVSWSMDIFFEDTADALWWDSGIGVGTVTRTADGFAFDVVLTDSVHSLRARGTVTCR